MVSDDRLGIFESNLLEPRQKLYDLLMLSGREVALGVVELVQQAFGLICWQDG